MKNVRFSSSVPFTSALKHIPRLSQELRQCVVQALEDASEEFSYDEVSYIRLKIEKKVEQVQTNSTFWVREVADGYNALYSWFEQELENEVGVESELIRFVGASLFYFINPFDIIPDHVINKGYADDALALNYTLRALPEDWHIDQRNSELE